jgi:hypothetical protein
MQARENQSGDLMALQYVHFIGGLASSVLGIDKQGLKGCYILLLPLIEVRQVA